MTLIIALSLAVSIAGLLLYLLVNNPARSKWNEAGRLMFAVGLLVFLMQVGPMRIGV